MKPKKPGIGGPYLLRLKGVPYTTTHQELVAAVEPFGTVRTAVLLKASEEVL